MSVLYCTNCGVHVDTDFNPEHFDNNGNCVVRCPDCGSDDYWPHHHEGNWLAPEGDWMECEHCGYQTDPQ